MAIVDVTPENISDASAIPDGNSSWWTTWWWSGALSRLMLRPYEVGGTARIPPYIGGDKDGIFQLYESSRSGIYLGNTDNTAKKVLDWYEEGSYTPSVTGCTGTASATYTRIGNRVMLTGQVSVSFSGVDATVSVPFAASDYSAGGAYITNIGGRTANMAMLESGWAGVKFTTQPASGDTLTFSITYRCA